MSASPNPSGGEGRTPEEMVMAALFEPRRETDARQDNEAKKVGGPPDLPSSDRAKTIHNERVKLTATLLNGVALAFIVGGAVATFLGIGNLPNPNDQLIRALIWTVAGGIVHVIARFSLGAMK